ncbi:hypothetical protein CMO95_00775 [Candidatus Woesearchaeota archaeon]|nr:hypothetical protein [Candidatus Woesearchaeota archaeon]|tara:strand:- start:20 stop:385 length:366 start_codon:yes stop_codon:yes gene_type:complete
MPRSYALLNRNKIKKFKAMRNTKTKNDIILIMGPIAKFKPEGSRVDDWVGNSGMYYVFTMKKHKRDGWVWGNKNTPIERVGVAKLIGEARRFGKAVYYAKDGKMKKIGPAIRGDYELNGVN